VTPLADEPRWLIGAFQGLSPAVRPRPAMGGAGPGGSKLRAAYRLGMAASQSIGPILASGMPRLSPPRQPAPAVVAAP
jgi:hypothetical protein